MRHQQQLKQLIRTLPPKQQSLDFGNVGPWTQLSAADRQACRDAIAALLFRVASAAPLHDEQSPNKASRRTEHER
jgi:hypothetical protein